MNSAWLLATVMVIYLAIAADLAITGRYGLALTHFAYGLGNLGLILEVIKR